MHTEGHILVVAICGSLRSDGHTRQALEIALQGAQEVGAEIQLIDLNEYALPFCEGKDDDAPPSAGVQRLRADVRRAQGILIGTPEYHGSFSGVLKNALDLLGFDEFEGKMIGLLGISGGRMGAVDALNSLRTIGRALHAWVIPQQATIPEAAHAFDEHGRLRNKALEQRVLEVGRQVARFAYLHSSEKAREFLRLWEESPANPGGGEHVEE